MSKIFDKLQLKNYMIGVPSRNRPFLIEKNMGIFKHIGNNPVHNVRLVIRKEEEASYREAGFKGTFILTENDTDITKTRQTILEYAKRHEYEYLFMFDDDINLNYRDEELSSKYTSRQEGFQQYDHFNKCLLESIQLCNKEYPLIGLPNRQGANFRKYMFEKNTMIIRYVCYHIPTWEKEGLRCDGLQGGVMEDYFVQLTLLSEGYRTLANCRYAVDDPGTGFRGGCNATRTVAIQNDSAIKLQAKFPDYVELKVKTDGKQHWSEDRYDVTVKWKKFLDEGELPYIPAEEAYTKYGIGQGY